MYVRWKRKPSARRWRREKFGDRLSAVLVESVRVDGRPRQRYVKHLGAIPEGAIAYGYWPIAFWETADAALASLDIGDDDRERIATALTERVPRPTKEYRAQLRASFAESEQRIV